MESQLVCTLNNYCINLLFIQLPILTAIKTGVDLPKFVYSKVPVQVGVSLQKLHFTQNSLHKKCLVRKVESLQGTYGIAIG
jgi:hypothetical protein